MPKPRKAVVETLRGVRYDLEFSTWSMAEVGHQAVFQFHDSRHSIIASFVNPQAVKFEEE